MKKQLWLILLLSLVVSSAAVTRAQDPAPTPTPAAAGEEDDKPIKIDTLLLTIPLTVSDPKGRNVPGLQKENFSIYQDGTKQSIEYFFSENAPMNVAILIDTSYSTREVLDKIQKAARDFLKVLRPEDKAVIVSFDARTLFLSGLTSDRKTLTRAIEGARIGEQPGSDMNDAVAQVIAKYFSQFEGRKAVIVLTDGMAMSRSLGTQKTLNLLQESDTIFYPIIFRTKFYTTPVRSRAGGGGGGARPLPIELMNFLAEETAGRFYEKDVADLKEAFQSISEEMKKQYLLGFYPQNSWHGNSLGHIRVALDREDLKVNLKKRRFDKN